MKKTIRVAETELKPVGNSRKSFYSKAFVLDDMHGTRYLKSYSTVICSVGPDGRVHRFYDRRLSNTTGRHLKSFLAVYAPKVSTKEFDNMNVEKTKVECAAMLMLTLG